MNQLSGMLAKALQAVYPGVVFDAEGLTSLLLPCLAIVLLGLIFALGMKLSRQSRRFAYWPVVLALIAAIAASAFFPASLMQAGKAVMTQLEQTAPAQETDASASIE